jgi:hypothetical protein
MNIELWTPTFEQTEQFFHTKGTAFKQLWKAKISKGMSYEDMLRLKAMIAVYLKKQHDTVS